MKPGDIRSKLISVGDHLPEATVRAIVALGSAATEPLMNVFADEALREGEAGQSAPAHAAKLLGELTPPDALPALLKEFLEGDLLTEIGNAAALAIPKYQGRALDALLQVYDAEPDPDRRAHLCVLLSELGVRDERIYERLVACFPRDIDMGATSFGAYGDPRALPLLQQALDAWQRGAEGMPDSPSELGHAIRELGGDLTLAQQVKLDRAHMERQHEDELQERDRLISPEEVTALRKALARATSRPLWNVRGFLAAIASGPTLVSPSEWAPALLEEGAADAKSALDLVERLMQLYNFTVDAMDEEPGLLCPAANDEQGCADFCEGYIDAAMRDPEWVRADRGKSELAPLILLTRTPSGDAMTDEEREQSAAFARLHLHEFVTDIHEGLAPLRAALEDQQARTVVSPPKVGRNEPCPCGSGKKFKRCCGRPGQPAPAPPTPVEAEDEEPELVHSPLSRSVTQDGVTVEICIYRGAGDRGWVLEVEDHLGGSTVWDDYFDTDQKALDEALEAIEEDGIGSFASGSAKA